MSTRHTTFAVDGPIAVLTFDRPEARNAMTWEMYDGLVEACDRVDRDENVRVMVLKGAGGRAFVAGTDIAQFQRFAGPADGVAYEHRLDDVLDRLDRVARPTIAQVQGVAAGGGCAIASCCDLRVATPESTFGIPIARTLGNCISATTCHRLVDLLGSSVVKDLLFTGRFLSAAEAERAGFVNRVAPAADIDRTVRELAMTIAGNAPLTVRASKEMLRRIAKLRLAAADIDRDLIELCYGSSDFREGVAAFVAKRKPEWKGK